VFVEANIELSTERKKYLGSFFEKTGIKKEPQSGCDFSEARCDSRNITVLSRVPLYIRCLVKRRHTPEAPGKMLDMLLFFLKNF